MVVTAVSPDGRITARFGNDLQARVEFRPRTFDDYDEASLAYQLARLGALSAAAFFQRRDEANRLARGMGRDEFDAAKRTSAADARRQAYEQDLRQVEAVGQSPTGAVTIRTVGPLQWEVHIEPGTLRSLGEQRFLAELHAALAALVADRRATISLLKAKHFDLGIPREWRDLTLQLLAAKADRRL